MTTVRDFDEPHFLFVTLHRRPSKHERIVLELRGEEAPETDYNILDNRSTGEVHIYKRDATWGDCCQCRVRLVDDRPPRREKRMDEMAARAG